MTFEADLTTLLTGNATIAAIVGAKVYPTVAPEATNAPMVIWARTSSQAAVLDGRNSLEQIALDVDCYGRTAAEAQALGRAVRDAIETSGGAVRGTLDTDSDSFDEGPRLYSRTLSFTVYHPAG